MAYVASGVGDNVDPYWQQSVGDGQCVAYVKKAARCPATSLWSEGDNVRTASNIPLGTAIATFQNGTYGNYTDGRSHAAIFIRMASDGLVVHDQWKGTSGTQPVHQRTILFKAGQGEPRNDGDAYSIIESRSLFSRIIQAFRRLGRLFSG